VVVMAAGAQAVVEAAVLHEHAADDVEVQQQAHRPEDRGPSDVEAVPAELYLQTHSTNPLLRPQTISAAVRQFRDDADHDSLFSVTPMHVRLWSIQGEPINHDPENLLRTQDLPPLYQENSCLYLFRRDVFLERRNRIGRRPRLFVIGREEAWDVDEEIDLDVVGALLRRRAEA